MGGLLSQLRQFRVLRESRLSFESDAMLDNGASGVNDPTATMARFPAIELHLGGRFGLLNRIEKCVRCLPPVTIKWSLSHHVGDGR